MDKKSEHEMETGIEHVFRDSGFSLNTKPGALLGVRIGLPLF